MLRKLSTLLLVISSLSLFCMDKKTWYVERDKWKPGINTDRISAEFASFDSVAKDLTKIAPGNKDVHRRLLIMQLINHKIKDCLIKILIEKDYKKEPKNRLIASDITDNFVIAQDVKETEIHPTIREYKEQINEFIDKIISCDLFKDYFMVLQPKFLAFLNPVMYINEDTLNDLNNYLFTVEQVALVLFSDESAAEKIDKLNEQKKDILQSMRLGSILDNDKREQLRKRLATEIVYAVRDLEVKAPKERKRHEQIEQEERELTAAENKREKEKITAAKIPEDIDKEINSLCRLSADLAALTNVQQVSGAKAQPALPPLPKPSAKPSLPLPSTPIPTKIVAAKAQPELPPVPKPVTVVAGVGAKPAEKVASQTMPAGFRRAQSTVKRKMPTIKKFGEISRKPTKSPEGYAAEPKKKEIATELPDVSRQLKAFGMRRVTIEPDRFAEVLVNLERWRANKELSVDLEKQYTQLQDKIKTLFNDRFKDKKVNLVNLVDKIRTEKEAEEIAAAERKA